MIILPEEIENHIQHLLNKSTNAWVKKAVSLSLRYRIDRSSHKYIENSDDVLGYLAVRAPSTYSQIYGALESIKKLNPNWQPKNILDIGSGPGTAIWAAAEIFSSLKNGTAVEMDNNFIKAGQSILTSIPEINIVWELTDLSKSLPKTEEIFDLVILANILNEMDEKTKNKVLSFAQNHSKGILLILEPGTPYGYEVVKQSAETLKTDKDYLVTPYIDNIFIDSEEVTFTQKIKRPDFQKRVRHLQRKNEQLEKPRLLPPSDWEESKYYYLAYSKFPNEITPTARLIDAPKPLKPFVELKILTGRGIRTERVFKKDRELYKKAKKLNRGDTFNSNFQTDTGD